MSKEQQIQDYKSKLLIDELSKGRKRGKRMTEGELEFKDDKLFVCTPLPEFGGRLCRVQLVMTKEIFQECYKRWIEEPQERRIAMCDFCEKIYPDEDTHDIVFGEGKYSNFNSDKDPFITIDKEGCYHLNVNPGDPYELGVIANVKYCPNCGAKLQKRSDNG